MSDGIDRDAWLAAIEAAKDPIPPTDALTTAQFAELFKLDRATATRRMARLVDKGLAERTKTWVRRTDGSLYPAPAYRLIKPPKKK